MGKHVENVFYATIAFAWTFFMAKAATLMFPDSLFGEILGALCGISLGILVAWSIKFLTHELKKQKSQAAEKK